MKDKVGTPFHDMKPNSLNEVNYFIEQLHISHEAHVSHRTNELDALPYIIAPYVQNSDNRHATIAFIHLNLMHECFKYRP